MKLIDIINKETDKLNYETHVDYRTHTPDGTDIFTGYCVINKAGEIIASDGDSYSKDDEFTDYKVCVSVGDEVYLECWYESEWIDCGNKHILKDGIKDREGNYHDDIIYEIVGG